jgi:uncharacterized protein (TIGR00251 family)
MSALPPCFRETPAGVQLAVKVQPRASRQEIAGLQGAELKIRISAPPVDSAANQALVEFVAECLGCSRGQVQLVRGGSSTHKTLLLTGVTAATAARLLLPGN